jgi:hypothetical protein
MDFAFPINLSLRDALIALVVLLALYLIVAFLRIRRLKRRKAGVAAPSPVAVQTAVAAYAAVQEPELKTEPEPARPDSRKREPEPLAAPSEAAFPWNEPPGETALLRQVALLESEIAQLRKEVGGLRAEVLILREEQQRVMNVAAELPAVDVVEEVVEVTSSVSPLYNEAMQFALQGLDAAAISQSCGISRAEAELVVALVRNRDL